MSQPEPLFPVALAVRLRALDFAALEEWASIIEHKRLLLLAGDLTPAQTDGARGEIRALRDVKRLREKVEEILEMAQKKI